MIVLRMFTSVSQLVFTPQMCILIYFLDSNDIVIDAKAIAMQVAANIAQRFVSHIDNSDNVVWLFLTGNYGFKNQN